MIKIDRVGCGGILAIRIFELKQAADIADEKNNL